MITHEDEITTDKMAASCPPSSGCREGPPPQVESQEGLASSILRRFAQAAAASKQAICCRRACAELATHLKLLAPFFHEVCDASSITAGHGRGTGSTSTRPLLELAAVDEAMGEAVEIVSQCCDASCQPQALLVIDEIVRRISECSTLVGHRVECAMLLAWNRHQQCKVGGASGEGTDVCPLPGVVLQLWEQALQTAGNLQHVVYTVDEEDREMLDSIRTFLGSRDMGALRPGGASGPARRGSEGAVAGDMAVGPEEPVEVEMNDVGAPEGFVQSWQRLVAEVEEEVRMNLQLRATLGTSNGIDSTGGLVRIRGSSPASSAAAYARARGDDQQNFFGTTVSSPRIVREPSGNLPLWPNNATPLGEQGDEQGGGEAGGDGLSPEESGAPSQTPVSESGLPSMSATSRPPIPREQVGSPMSVLTAGDVFDGSVEGESRSGAGGSASEGEGQSDPSSRAKTVGGGGASNNNSSRRLSASSRKSSRRASGLEGQDEPPSEYLCPITRELMSDPVMVATGQTYERSQIRKWISEGHRTCPLTGLPLHSIDLLPNYALRQCIQQWAVRHGVVLPPPENAPPPRSSGTTYVAANGRGNGSGREAFGQGLPDRHSPAMMAVVHLYRSPSALQESAIRQMCTMASEGAEDGRVAIAEAGGIPPLVCLLHSGSPLAKELSARCLRFLCRSNNPLVTQAAACAIPFLTQLLREGTPAAQEAAAGALVNLSAKTDVNKFAIAAAGAIPSLAQMLDSSRLHASASAQEVAAAALCNMSVNDENRVEIAAAGAIPLLVQVAKCSPTPEAGEYSAHALGSLACDNDHNAITMVQAGAVPVLVHMAGHGTPWAQEAAARALRNLSFNDAVKGALCEAGAIQQLGILMETGTPRAAEAAVTALWNLGGGMRMPTTIPEGTTGGVPEAEEDQGSESTP